MYNKITEHVKIEDFAEKLELEILFKGGKDYIQLSTVNVNRPGMQFTGYFDHFGYERVQLMGEMETSYLSTLTKEAMVQSVEKFMSYNMPCIIFSTGLKPSDEFMQAAAKYNRPVFVSQKRTSLIANNVVMYLNDLLAPTETRHGVLIDLYGVGVLLTGTSGVGKSETALELVQRGHRLVADDAVVIKRVNDILTGTSPAVIRYFMEVRGIGIIDVRSMYGVGAIKNSKMIDLVVELEDWDDNKEYDRLGLSQHYEEILDLRLPKMIIPVRPGRNLAVIMEVAARNHRLKSMGFSALEELDRRMKK